MSEFLHNQTALALHPAMWRDGEVHATLFFSDFQSISVEAEVRGSRGRSVVVTWFGSFPGRRSLVDRNSHGAVDCGKTEQQRKDIAPAQTQQLHRHAHHGPETLAQSIVGRNPGKTGSESAAAAVSNWTPHENAA